MMSSVPMAADLHMGLEAAIDELPVVADFARAHPNAGSFWDVHGSGGPDDMIERHPHAIWTGLAGARCLDDARAGPSCGPIAIHDTPVPDTLLLGDEKAHPRLAAFFQAVHDAVREGHAVVSWVEFES